MDTETLKTVHSHQLHIAEEIKRICDKYDIKYFLDRGTLLGVVRHQGFIPWDCNFCIGMLRDDYNRFIREAENEINDKYYLQNFYNERYFGDNYTKVRMYGNIFKEKSSSTKLVNEGVCVNVFVYDSYPDNIQRRKRQSKKLDRYLNYLLAKTYSVPWKKEEKRIQKLNKKIQYALYRFSCLLVSKEKLIQKYEKELISNEASDYYFSHNSKSKYGNRLISRECFEEFIELSLEGIEFSCPGDCDLFLKETYGDYTILPPEEDRVIGLDIVKAEI